MEVGDDQLMLKISLDVKEDKPANARDQDIVKVYILSSSSSSS